MCGTPIGVQPHTQDAARGRAQAVVRRLTVDQIAHALRCAVVRNPGAVTAPFFADDEQQRDPRFTRSTERLGSRHLRSEDALRIAGATAEEHPALLATWKERRHTIEVR